jgi:hypothetical protein
VIGGEPGPVGGRVGGGEVEVDAAPAVLGGAVVASLVARTEVPVAAPSVARAPPEHAATMTSMQANHAVLRQGGGVCP